MLVFAYLNVVEMLFNIVGKFIKSLTRYCIHHWENTSRTIIKKTFKKSSNMSGQLIFHRIAIRLETLTMIPFRKQQKLNSIEKPFNPSTSYDPYLNALS